MSPRTLAVLTGVAAVLALVYVVSTREPAPPPAPAWISFDTSAIHRVEIQNPLHGKLFLERDGQTWKGMQDTVEVIPDTGAVDELLTMFLSLKSSELVSESPEKYRLFALDTANELLVRLNDPPAAVVHVGRDGPGGEFTYLRRNDDPVVWAVTGFQGWKIYRFFRPAQP